MEKENSITKTMGVCMMGNGNIIKCMEEESYSTLLENQLMMEIGLETNLKDLVNYLMKNLNNSHNLLIIKISI